MPTLFSWMEKVMKFLASLKDNFDFFMKVSSLFTSTEIEKKIR